MWLVLAVVIVTSRVEAKTHSSHLHKLNNLDDLDYSHNIFIPLNAYENQELFMEFARSSGLGKRTDEVAALPEISALPASGTKTYLVPGVNCQVQLKDETIDGSSKRVIERSTCAEGWTIESALTTFFGDVGQSLETETGGLVHTEQLKFKMLVFESDGYTLYGDASETYTHMQSKLSLSGVTFEYKLPTAYSFAAAVIKITGTHTQVESSQDKEIAVSFEKTNGSSVFAVMLTVPQMMMETFASIFISSSEFTASGIADSKYGLTFDPVKELLVKTSSSDTVIGVFNPSNGNFQLTGKFSSSNQNAFSGESTDILLTVDCESLGASVSFNLMFGFPETFAVKDAVAAFVPNNADAFNDRMLNNIISKWYLSFTSSSFPVMTETTDYTELFSAAFPDDSTKEFIVGVGLMLPVNLYETLSSCQEGDTGLSDALKVTYMTSLLTDKGLTSTYPAGTIVPLKATVKCQVAESETVSVPDALEQIEEATGLKLEELTFDTGTGEVAITLLHDGNIVIYKDILEIDTPTLEVTREGTGEPWSYTLSADVTVFGIEASCSVSYSDKTVSAEVSADVIPLTTFLSAFSSDLDPPFTFEIHSFTMQIEFSTEAGGDKKLAVSGMPVFNGFDKVTVEAMVWTGTPTGVALAVVLDQVRLDEVLEQILGMSDIPMAWFSEMTLILAVSNTEASGCENPAADCEEAEEDEKEGSNDAHLTSHNSSSGNKYLRNRKEKKKNTKKTIKKSSKKVNRKVSKKAKKRSSKRGNKQIARSYINQGGHIKNQISTILQPKVMEERSSKRFELEHLGGIDLVKGLYIKASFFLPSDCKNDDLCEWMKQKFGTDAELYIEGTFDSSGFTLTAGINVNLELTDALFLTEAKLTLMFTTQERSVSLVCALKYDNSDLNPEPLTFYGALTVSFTGELELSMAMQGLIYEPFGIPKFAFGDMVIALGITIAAGLPSFQIGATIRLGKVSADTDEGQFIFSGYFGFNPSDPTDNYVYAQRSGDPLTIENFIKNFELGDVTLPAPIADSGFYGETIFSFSAQGKTLEEIDLEIQAGFYFMGTLRILDVEIFAEININTDPDSLRIFANITMTPISWVGGEQVSIFTGSPCTPALGLLRISRASDDDINGPYLVVDISQEQIDVDIAGFAYCLGISAEIRVIINNTHFYFHIEGDLFTIFQANLTVAASFGGALADMEYDFNGCASFDLTEIAAYVYEAIKNAQEAISGAFDKAKAKVENARAAVSTAFDKISEWEDSIESYKARLRARSEELEAQRAALDYSCSDKCGQVCVGFMDWNSRCWRVWGRWVGCPQWNSCKWKVDDIICIAACELERAWDSFVTWAEQIGIQIMLGLSEVAQGLLSGVAAFEGVVNGVLDFANGVLSAAETFTNGILNAVNAIVQGLASAIVVEYFCVSGNLKPVESVCVGCKAKMTLLGETVQWDGDLCIDLSFFGAIGEKTAITHTPDIALIDSKVQEFESDGDDVDQKVETMQQEQATQEGEVNSGTSQDVDTNFSGKRSHTRTSFKWKRSHVPTEEEAYFYRVAYGRIPDVNIRSFKTEKSMKEGAPWVLAENWTPTKRTLEIDESAPQKRILKIDEKDHCKLMENVYSNYNNIADGFGTFLKNAKRQKAGFNAMKRSYLSGINYVKNVFDKGDQRHNITDEEREHVKYWYDYLDNGISQHIEKTDGLFEAQRKTYIPDFRRQVNELITKEARFTLPEFVTKMKDAILKAYEKRSGIPKPALNKQTKKWETLHETFQEISSNEEASYEDLAAHVAKATRLLADMKRSEIPCAP